jgi:phosphatidylglycerophosphatase A
VIAPPPAILATFGLGHFHPAPGTWGSLPPVLLAAALLALGVGPGVTPLDTLLYYSLQVITLVVFSAACITLADRAAAYYRRADPSQVVADETAGMALTILLIPPLAVATPGLAVITLTFAFVAFRAMDIFKPWPAWRLQEVPGGWGILLDDLAAAVWAGAAVQIVARVCLS